MVPRSIHESVQTIEMIYREIRYLLRTIDKTHVDSDSSLSFLVRSEQPPSGKAATLPTEKKLEALTPSHVRLRRSCQAHINAFMPVRPQNAVPPTSSAVACRHAFNRCRELPLNGFAETISLVHFLNLKLPRSFLEDFPIHLQHELMLA